MVQVSSKLDGIAYLFAPLLLEGPHCGKARRSKGVHHTVFRTVFGTLPVESPRLSHCPCQPHTTTSFSPLATLLPERTTPDLLYLETKWAALMGDGKEQCKIPVLNL